MATGALGTRKAVEYPVQIARGLAAAHEKGIMLDNPISDQWFSRVSRVSDTIMM